MLKVRFCTDKKMENRNCNLTSARWLYLYDKNPEWVTGISWSSPPSSNTTVRRCLLTCAWSGILSEGWPDRSNIHWRKGDVTSIFINVGHNSTVSRELNSVFSRNIQSKQWRVLPHVVINNMTCQSTPLLTTITRWYDTDMPRAWNVTIASLCQSVTWRLCHT